MEIGRPAVAPRSKTLHKKASLASASSGKVVSAAPVFKRAETVPYQKTFNNPPKKRRSSYHKEQSPHPLAVAFEDATSEYRNTLLSSSIKALEESRDTLISTLHECNLIELPSPPGSLANGDPQASPLRLTLSAAYDRKYGKLFIPLGDYHLRSRVTNAAGDKEVLDTTLRDKLARFEEQTLKDMEQLRALQKQWESVVGEIWKTGVSCLGEDAMVESFLAPPPHEELAEKQVNEDSIFVPEQSKKRVTFENPPLPELPDFFTSASQLPDFLTGASKMKTLPHLPELAREEVEELEVVVAELGDEHVADLRAIDKDYQKFWERKLGSMRKAVEGDE